MEIAPDPEALRVRARVALGPHRTHPAIERASIKTVGAVVASSSSPVSDNSLKDLTWLDYFENKKPEMGKALIDKALQQNDSAALATIRENKDDYSKLNAFITDFCSSGQLEAVACP